MPTQTYLSLAEFPGDGVTTEWDFNFAGGYISRAHVKAWTQDPQGVVTAHVIEPGDFITDFRVTVSPPVPEGHTLRIYRDTPREEPLVNFTGGSNFTEANLDLLAKQTIFCAAEAFDAGDYARAFDLISEARAAAARAEAAADRVDLGELAASVASSAAAAVAANLSAGIASSSATAATNAAAASFTGSGVYVNTTAGLAAVTLGGFFQVVAGDSAIAYRHDAGPVATPVATYPAGTSVAALRRLAISYGLPAAVSKLVEGSGSVSPSLFRAFSYLNATSYELVAEVKADERSQVQLISGNAGAVFDRRADLLTGGAWTPDQPVVTNLGNGWWEVKHEFICTASGSGNFQLRFFPGTGAPYTGNGTSGILCRRFEMRRLGVNQWPSSDPSDVSFTKQNLSVVTVTDSPTPLPVATAATRALSQQVYDRQVGTLSADKIVVASGASVSPSCYKQVPIVNGEAVEVVIEAKAGERARLNVFSSSGVIINTTLGLTLGTIEGSGATAEPLGNGWFRYTLAYTASATGSANIQLRPFGPTGGNPQGGDGTSGLFVRRCKFTIGGRVLFDADDFTRLDWTKQDCTISANAGLYIGPDATAPNPDDALLLGLKVAIIGTSITAQAQYTAPLVTATGIVLTNLGIGGASIGVNAHSGSTDIFDTIASIPTDSELVLIEAGTNDHGVTTPTPLGTLGDTTTATFYGALYAANVAIRARAPSAKIAYLTPYAAASSYAGAGTYKHEANALGATLVQFQKAVEDVAHLTACPLIDVGRQGGIGTLTGSLMYDGLHINAGGGEVFAGYVAEDLRALARRGAV
jgi:lysophospholipase L1-like esterase